MMTPQSMSERDSLPVDGMRVRGARLWRGALLAATIAAVANLVVLAVERLGLGLPLPVPQGGDGALAPVTPAMVVIACVVAALVATLLLTILGRFTRRPIRPFLVVSAVALLISFAGPLSQAPDAATKVGLSVMHVVAAAAIVGALTAMARPRTGSGYSNTVYNSDNAVS